MKGFGSKETRKRLKISKQPVQTKQGNNYKKRGNGSKQNKKTDQNKIGLALILSTTPRTSMDFRLAQWHGL